MSKPSICLSSIFQIVQYHYFCGGCDAPLESQNGVCEHCELGHKVNYFLAIPLVDQLQSMFLRPGFYEALLFRFQRTKRHEANLEDIYDGQIYRNQMQNGFLDNQNHISFMWYSDGISIFKSSNFSIWPMFLIINRWSLKRAWYLTASGQDPGISPRHGKTMLSRSLF